MIWGKTPYELQNLSATADPALLEQLSSRLVELRRCVAAGCRAAEDAPLPMTSLLRKTVGGLYGAQVELWTLEEIGAAEPIRQVAAAGAETIILRVFDYEDEPNPGIYFQIEHAPVKRDILGDLLEEAHAAGLRVFVWMTALNLPWVLQEHPHWAVIGYDWEEERYTSQTGCLLGYGAEAG